MHEDTQQVEHALAIVARLSLVDKARLVEKVSANLAHDLSQAPQSPRKSCYGVLAGWGPAPSAEQGAEARTELWANFPREDI